MARFLCGLGCGLLLLASGAWSASAPVDAERPRVALVLSGGGALGYAHIGVLKVLEEMQVPVDCVVGTSMGALVGGTFAAGVSPSQMEAMITRTDVGALFDDEPKRSELSQRVKRDDYSALFNLSLGFNGGEVQLPSGAAAGYKFELFLKQLIGLQMSHKDLRFDDLPTPYRAIATDLENGEMKAFDRGELPRVMRASMSLPGIVAPTEVDGRIYVDGGMTNNLPVVSGRDLCGDVIIAVNLGTQPRTRAEIRSSIDVALQSITLLIGMNMRASLQQLRAQDVLITPQLEGFASGSFDQQQAIIARGEAAARASAAQLAPLALPPPQYQQWLAARAERVPPAVRIKAITTQADGVVSAETLARDVKTQPGDAFSLDNLNADIASIYGRGDFSYVGYSVIPDGDEATISIDAQSKPWGPGFLKLGFGAAMDFSSPTQLNFGASYRRSLVNSLGAEWRADMQVGYDSFLRTEFIQPLQLRDGAFLAPYLGIRRDFVEYYLADERVGDYRVERAQGGVDVGVSGIFGELRLGPYLSHIDADPDFGLANSIVEDVAEEQRGTQLTGILDQLDRPQFPRSGYRARMDVRSANLERDTAEDYVRAWVDATAVGSLGKNTLALHLEWGDEVSGAEALPVYDRFELGGPNRLSGLFLNQLTGSHYELASLRYYRQYSTLPAPLGTGTYWGVALETGRIDDPLMEDPWQRVNSANLFWAADTVLGNVYLGYGYAPSLDQSAWYLVIGPHF